MPPSYTLDKIKFATDAPTFKRAVGLYENKKIAEFSEELNGYFATVLGTKPYRVYVDKRHYDQGDCECYLGQHETLCKHMVAVAIHAVKQGKKLSEEDKEKVSSSKCSGKLGELSKEDLAETKRAITTALRYIKPYSGPSRTWFAYQNSLDEGVARLSKIVVDLPVSRQTAKLLVNTLLRLEKKLCHGGVDDSNGTVGGFIYETAAVLEKYCQFDQECIKEFAELSNKEPCFDWENDLVKLFDKYNKK